ncbi:hypothetical protein GCM10029964_092910 [Kibdelosporangium lantanae]
MSPVTTLLVQAERPHFGTATLTEIECCPQDDQPVLLVSVDERAAEAFGAGPAGVIGGLYRHGRRWMVTAYRDRDHLLSNTGLAYFLPDATSRQRAVRALLRWWWYVGRETRDGANPATLDPFEKSAAFRRDLLR